MFGKTMSLEIGIGDGSSFSPVSIEPSVSLENDGYYWYLHPILEDLRAATGQYIDLYGDASFTGENRRALEAALKSVRLLIQLQSDKWNVCIGQQLVPYDKLTRSRPHLREVMASVEKSQFLSILNQLDAVVTRAKQLNSPVVCFGD